MEVKPTELKAHVTKINAVLQDVCDVSNTGPLVQQQTDGTITVSASCPRALCKEVITDFGVREFALRLPIPNADQARFWIALHERWAWKSKRRVFFRECGLRLYLADPGEEAVNLLRLEWVAPTSNFDGPPIYPGKHAGHPHWQIDRSALTGQEDYLRSLEALTAPESESQLGLEDFSETTIASGSTQPPFLHDCSFLRNMHLPAQAEWMKLEWDGYKIPGPHQCEPNSLEELGRWWSGALRYFLAELPR
jgi:hypothetical protein